MAREITEKFVRRMIGRMDVVERVGAGSALLDPRELTEICESWLEQHEALRWIPVSERLPPDNFQVQLLLADGSVNGGCIKKSGKWYVYGRHDDITHWRPIGPLPKEGE